MATKQNYEIATLMNGTSINDNLTNYGTGVTVSGGGGNDTIINDGDVLSDESNPFLPDGLKTDGKYSSLVGNEGNDVLIDKVGYSTLAGGYGNDRATLGAFSVYEYATGDGKDTIDNLSADKTIYIKNGTYTTVTSGADVIINVGAGSLTLKNGRDSKVKIVGAGEEVSPNFPSDYTKVVAGTARNDTLYARQADVTVNGGAGNDLLVNDVSSAVRSLLNGGKGDDTLVSSGVNVILVGDKGDDLIELAVAGQIVRYSSGDGVDTVSGYRSSDTIHLIDGADFSTVKSGNDVVVKVGDGSIVVRDAANKTLNIDTTVLKTDDDVPIWENALPTSENLSFNRSKGIITLKDGFEGEVDASNFAHGNVVRIDASNVRGAVELRGGKKALTLLASQGGSLLQGAMGSDKMYGGAGSDLFVYTVGEGADVINDYEYSDAVIIVSEEHVSLEDVSIKDSKASVIITFNGDKKSKLTVNKVSSDTPLTIYFGSDIDKALENGYVIYGELPEGVKYGLKNGAQDFNRLVLSETLSSATINASEINSQITEIDASSVTGSVEIHGNARNNVLNAGAGGATLSGAGGNDKLYGNAGADTFVFQMQSGGKKDVIYNYRSGDEIVIDTSLIDADEEPIFDADAGLITYSGAKANFNGFNDAKNDVIVTLNKKNVLTIKDAVGQAIRFTDTGGNELGTYGHILPSGLKYTGNRTGIEVEDAALVESNGALDINLSNENGYENAYFATTKNVTLSGVKADATLVGSSASNILKAGDGATEIRGGAGNDFIHASTVEGARAEIYYTSGKDVIYNFDPKTDYIYIDGDTPIDTDVLYDVTARSFSEKGNDVVLTLGKNNSITFKDGVGKIIEVFDDTGAINGGEGVVRYDYSLPDGLIYNSSKRTAIDINDSDATVAKGFIDIDLSGDRYTSTVKRVDLSAIADETFSARLIGNNQANELHAPNGGENELYGGHGTGKKAIADKLHGGSGADVFIYGVGDGKDQIIGYGAGDIVWLDETYGVIDTIALTDKKNVVTVELNGDKNSTFTIEKTDINQAIEFRGFGSTLNGSEQWSRMTNDGFIYGVDADHMTLSADGVRLTLGGTEEEYVYANAREIGSQIRVIDAGSALGAEIDITGNGNGNVIYGGTGGGVLDGGYDAIRGKSTNDMLVGNSGDDVFAYNFADGLGGKDTITGYGDGDDLLRLDTAPKSVTTNGKNLVLNFEDTIDGKKYKGTLTVNGERPITSSTVVNIEIDGELNGYRFESKLRNAAWDSEGITVERGETVNIDGTVEALPTAGNTAEQWTMLNENSYAYDYAGVEFTVSGSAVRDWAPDNNFERGAVIDLIVSDGIPDGIKVDAANKTIVLSDQFDESKARFTFGNDESVEDYSWKKYITMVPTIEYELPTEDYWFEGGAIDESPLNEIVSTEAALDLSTEFLPPARPWQFATADIVGGSARRHQK